MSILEKIMNNDYGDSSAIVAAAWLFFFGLTLASVLVGYLLHSWFLSRIFRKAGIAQGKAWVPYYNIWVFFELGGQAGWVSLLALIPGAGIIAVVFLYIAAYNIGAAFQKPGGGWVVLYIFLPLVWLGIVGFDRSTWNPTAMNTAPRYGSNVRLPTVPQSTTP